MGAGTMECVVPHWQTVTTLASGACAWCPGIIAPALHAPCPCSAQAISSHVAAAGLSDKTAIFAPPLPISFGTHHR